MDDAVTKLAWNQLQKNIEMHAGIMIDMKTGEALGREADYTRKLLVCFIVFIDRKITCCWNELLNALNESSTLGTVGTFNFLQKIFLGFFSSLFKQYFPLFFRNLLYFWFVFPSNIFFELTIFLHHLQYFMKFSGGNIFILNYLSYNILSSLILFTLKASLNCIILALEQVIGLVFEK